MELYTNGLLLKTVTAEDIDEVARMWAFEKGSISKEEAKDAIAYMQNNHRENSLSNIHHLCLAISKKGERKIIGWCGLDGTAAGKLHIFFLIDKDYRNKGYATQCAGRLLAYAFDEAHVPFVNGGCDKNNAASYRVMVKAGMRQDGFEANGDPLFFIDDILYRENNVRGQ